MQLTQQDNRTQNCHIQTPPNSAQAYLQSTFAAELGNPVVSDIRQNKAVTEQMGQKDNEIQQELVNNGAYNVRLLHDAISARLKWPDGREGIALVGLTKGELVMLNKYNGNYSRIFSGSTTARVVYIFPSGQQKKAEEQFSVMISSRRTNPDWQTATDNFWKKVRYQQTQETRRKVALMDERTRAITAETIRKGSQRLAEIDNQMRSWESKQNAQDKMHSNFIKTIRGVENFQDASGTVEVSSGYNHVWNSNDGSNTYLMSNNPNFNPSSVFQDSRWKEMKKVD